MKENHNLNNEETVILNIDNKEISEVEEKREESEEKPEEKSEEKPEEKSEEKPEEEVLATVVDEIYIDTVAIEKFKKRNKILKITLISIIISLFSTYLASVVYFSIIFPLHTYINGVNVSYMSVDESQEMIQNEIDNYELKIIFNDSEEIITKDMIDLDIKLDKSIKEVKDKQKKDRNPFIWLATYNDVSDIKIKYIVTYDENKLYELINQFDCVQIINRRLPVDATIAINGEAVEIVPENKGNYIYNDVLFESIKKALYEYQKEIIADENNCYLAANINSESIEIENAKNEITDFMNLSIRYSINGGEYKLSKEELGELLYINKDLEVCISKTKTREFVNKLAKKYDTVGTIRNFKTRRGKTIEITNDWYGNKIDVDAEVNDLYIKLSRKKSFLKEPIYSQEAYGWYKDSDLGDTYVEVDLGNQHMYMIVDGRIVLDSDLVSGCVNKGMSTPGGLYVINYKKYKAILRGSDYETPVDYWMPFNQGIGLHDATWRYAFGGEIYVNDGSHGCVNLPYGVAQSLYQYVEPGMPVICYWE